MRQEVINMARAAARLNTLFNTVRDLWIDVEPIYAEPSRCQGLAGRHLEGQRVLGYQPSGPSSRARGCQWYAHTVLS
jgi:hypothetical protein